MIVIINCITLIHYLVTYYCSINEKKNLTLFFLKNDYDDDDEDDADICSCGLCYQTRIIMTFFTRILKFNSDDIK